MCIRDSRRKGLELLEAGGLLEHLLFRFLRQAQGQNPLGVALGFGSGVLVLPQLFVDQDVYKRQELEFEEDALEAIAEKTMERNTGARGLRSVLEDIITGIMFDVPSDPTISRVVVTQMCIRDSR